MSCESVLNKLTENLSSRFDVPVAAHLDECSECRSCCEDLVELKYLVQSCSGKHRVPSQFESETLSRLAQEKPSRLPSFRLVAVCVTLLMVTVGIVYSWEDETRIEEDRGLYIAAQDLHFESEPLEIRPSAEAEFVEVVVEETPGNTLILRLPSVIEIRRTEVSEDLVIADVSH